MKNWRYIEEDNVTADYGLAADEFLMNSYSGKNVSAATLRLYTYQDCCALVGRFQNIHAELDLDTCRKEKIQFSRRLTGGGAIIMGQGQLGICLATNNTFGSGNTRDLYHIFSRPVLKVLETLGIRANFQGKNDLVVNGKKIAGLGIHVNPFGAIQFHTSLLVDLDILLMLKVLKIPLQKIRDKAQIHKVEQRITTISKELNRPSGQNITTGEIRKLIKKSFEECFDISWPASRVSKLHKSVSDVEKREIEKIAKEKYRNEHWIFQNSPQPDMTGIGLKKTNAGLLRTYVALKSETIKSVLITGDFFGYETLFKNIEAQLKWSPAEKECVDQVVQKACAQFGLNGDLSQKEITDVIWRATLGAMKEVQYSYIGSCYYPEMKKEKIL